MQDKARKKQHDSSTFLSMKYEDSEMHAWLISSSVAVKYLHGYGFRTSIIKSICPSVTNTLQLNKS